MAAEQITIDRRTLTRTIVGVAGVVVLAALILLSIKAFGGEADPLAGRIDRDRYQVVVLANDRAYYGHLRTLGDGMYELKDAYFVRPEQGAEEGETLQRVVPVSEDPQGPDDTMFLNADFIALIGNLADDSPVVEAIEEQGS